MGCKWGGRAREREASMQRNERRVLNSSLEHFGAIIPPPCSDWRHLPYHWGSLMRPLGNRVRVGHKGVPVIQDLEAMGEIQPPRTALVRIRDLWRGLLKCPLPEA